MRIGVCTRVENISKLEAMGFDYIEWSVSDAMSRSAEDFNNIIKLVDSSSIKCEAFNLFFPGDFILTGPDADEEKIYQYVKTAMERISRLGAKVAVVGNGRARSVPEGWSKEKGLEQFAKVMAMIGREASQYGITALVEPLNSSETNLINSVIEAKELVERINHPSVKLIVDFYHMRRDLEDVNHIREAKDLLCHLHIANSNGRVYPMDINEDAYGPFFKALKDIGYNGRISIEASTNSFDTDAPCALKFLREISA